MRYINKYMCSCAIWTRTCTDMRPSRLWRSVRWLGNWRQLSSCGVLMVLYRCWWCCAGVHGAVRVLMVLYGCWWFCTGADGAVRVLMVLYRCWRWCTWAEEAVRTHIRKACICSLWALYTAHLVAVYARPQGYAHLFLSAWNAMILLPTLKTICGH